MHVFLHFKSFCLVVLQLILASKLSELEQFEKRAENCLFVKLREREGQRVDLGRSLKGHLWMVDGGYPFPDALH